MTHKVLKFRDMKLYSRQMERESTYSNSDTRQKRNQGEKSLKGKKISGGKGGLEIQNSEI